MIVVKEFHSHLEPMSRITDLEDQISLSYLAFNGVFNVIRLEGPFPKEADPTR